MKNKYSDSTCIACKENKETQMHLLWWKKLVSKINEKPHEKETHTKIYMGEEEEKYQVSKILKQKWNMIQEIYKKEKEKEVKWKLKYTPV